MLDLKGTESFPGNLFSCGMFAQCLSFPSSSVWEIRCRRGTLGNMQLWTPPGTRGWGQCGVWNDGGRVWRVVRRRKDTLGKLRPHQWRFRLRSHHSGGHSGVIQSICVCFRSFYPPSFSVCVCLCFCLCVPGVHVPTEELWDSLEVEVQVFVSCQVRAEEPDLGA